MAEPFFEFEWDDEKAQINYHLHGIAFEEAETVFDDPYAFVIDDPDHSMEEHREIIIGHSNKNRMLFVSYTRSHPGAIRIISARKAVRQERKEYEEKDRKE